MQKYLISILISLIPLIAYSQAEVFIKKIDFSCSQRQLSDALVDLSRESGVNIAFDPSIIPNDQLVTVEATNQILEDIILLLLKGTNLEYELIDNQIIIVQNLELNSKGEYTYSGFLIDAMSGERLPFAHVYNDSSNIGTTTNEYGFFSIDSPQKYLKLTFSFTGFETSSIILNHKFKSLSISLKPNVFLNEIIIKGSRVNKYELLGEINTIPLQDLYNMTSLGGEPDIIRLVSMQSGVSTGADGLGGLNIRGGTADQNLILLDGVPVYNIGHTLGMFSIFNSSVIKSTQLYKDAFPSKYGGRLSSVLDIRTREGNLKEFAGEIAMGTIATKVTIEGPILKDKCAFIFSARKSVLDFWINKASSYIKESGNSSGELNYGFYDVNAKIHLLLGENATLYFNFYEGNDHFKDETFIPNIQDSLSIFEKFNSEWKWGNRIASVRLSTKIGKKLFLNSILYYSRFTFEAFKKDQALFEINSSTLEDIFDASLLQTSINDLGFRLDFDYSANNNNKLQFGLDAVMHNFNPQLVTVSELNSNISHGDFLTKSLLIEGLTSNSEIGYEMNLYVEDKIKLNNKIETVIGLRGSAIRSRNKNYVALLPVVSLNAKFAEDLLFKFSYSNTNQYLHLLTSSGLGLPTDIWLPTTDQLQPQSAWQLSSGFVKHFNDFGYLEIGGFYKKMEKILTLREGPIFDINQSNDWQFDIPIGNGLNYGFESKIAKNVGKFNGEIAYTWSKATRQFEDINNGKSFPFTYDRRHMINAHSTYSLNERIEFASNFIYLTGNWVTLPTNFSPAQNGSSRVIFIYTQKNNVRLKDYMRIDLALNWYHKNSWGNQKMSFGIYNLLNRSNPLYYFFRRQDDNILKFEKKQISLLPILPSISYSLAF